MQMPSLKSMTSAAIAALGLFLATQGPAAAAIETDPQALYQKMNQAYAEGTAQGWTFDAHRYYASAVYATGRSYSLFQHDNPNYAAVATLTVQVATTLHYDPLNSDDASQWWIREAAAYVRDHNPTQAEAANDLLNRIDEAGETYENAARIAAADAAANVTSFHGDSESRVQEVVIALRAAQFGNDNSYKMQALAVAAEPNFPLVRLPTIQQSAIYQIAQDLLDDKTANPDDRAHAKSILDRRNATPELQEIGSVHAIAHQFHLSITAPADEYFGHQGLSVLGIHNLMTHLDAYLKAGYGAREASEGAELTDALRTLQRTYPRDFELPKLLGEAVALVGRIPSNDSLADVHDLGQILVYNYPQSAQAQALLAQTRTDGASATTSDVPPAEAPQSAPAAQPAADTNAPPRAQPDVAQHPPFRQIITPSPTGSTITQ